VFDDGLGRLGPLVDLRASFDVRTGALTNLERLRAVLAEVMGVEVAALVCGDAVAELTRERTELPVNPASLATVSYKRLTLPPTGSVVLSGGPATYK